GSHFRALVNNEKASVARLALMMKFSFFHFPFRIVLSLVLLTTISISAEILAEEKQTKEQVSFTPQDWGPNSWLKNTPGTQITGHSDTTDIMGIVVDPSGQPVSGVHVDQFRTVVNRTDEAGVFRVNTQGEPRVLRAYHPDYEIWFGAPLPGDEIRIQLEPKKEKVSTHKTVHVVDARNAAPIKGVTVTAIRWNGPRRREVAASVVTNVEGIAQFDSLDPILHHLQLSAESIVPYIKTQRNTSPEISIVVLPLEAACELTLRAVDAETGEGIPGVKFGREMAGAEDWLHVLVPDAIGSKLPVRYDFDPDPDLPPESAYETDADGYYRCLVESNPWSYMVYQSPPGYRRIVPINGRQETRIETPPGGKVEYTFRLLKKKPQN
ncbi:MAG: hypothetical protein KDA65_18335, partial [Planctomycetaceae bacterium]|nr:hypothetical protein [Planctomycetaceae bacterium]